MILLAHRGLWTEPGERNTPAAFDAALRLGFGLETDVRDQAGELVISHDVPVTPCLRLRELLARWRQGPPGTRLALNVKADGLKERLRELLSAEETGRCFVFDMSVPETLQYRRQGTRFFTRQSEFEPEPVLYREAAGVWLDMFTSDWARPEALRAHLDAGKEVALVSPELHRRDPLPFWTALRAAGLGAEPGLMLCTDLPREADRFFHE